MKCKIYLFFLAFFYTLLSVGQGHYAISFSDKNNSSYSISSPYQFLSQKAIERRIKQNIPITISDLPVNATYISTLTNLGAAPIYASKWMNLVVVEIVDTSMLNNIQQLSFVNDVQIIKSSITFSENKKKFNKLYVETTQELDYGSSSNQLKIMEGDFLHNLGFKGNGVTIAVLDAGFTNVHQLSAFSSLWNNNQILGFKDFVDGDDSVFVEHTHGTMVLSTMATNIPGSLVGTAPNANYYLLRTEDALTETLLEEYNWLAGAEFADSVGADIINSSLGYTEFDDTTQNHTYADMNGNTTIISKAANWAAEKGILVVNSAGNSGAAPWKYIGAPADAPKILSIGAIDNDGI
ncbi:MAG: peptidase S8, partial [Bacteroidetes bacterium HGW-Bacteroidetes-12]